MGDTKTKEVEAVKEGFFTKLLSEYSKTNKRLITVIIVILCLWFATVTGLSAGFIWYLNQYEYTTESVVVDSQDTGTANYIGENGDINN